MIDSRHEAVQSQAFQEDYFGENRGRENWPCVTCKESFQSGAQQPDLDNEEDDALIQAANMSKTKPRKESDKAIGKRPIFTEGKAGTILEIFQDITLNYSGEA